MKNIIKNISYILGILAACAGIWTALYESGLVEPIFKKEATLVYKIPVPLPTPTPTELPPIPDSSSLAPYLPPEVAEAKRKIEDMKQRMGKKPVPLPPENILKSNSSLGWNYATSLDKMGRGQIKYAVIRSANLVEFKFPFEGKQRAEIILIKHSSEGDFAVLYLEKGLFEKNEFYYTINVRANSGSVLEMKAYRAAPDRLNAIYFIDYNGFVEQLQQANSLQIEAQISMFGPVVFDFDVKGLKW